MLLVRTKFHGNYEKTESILACLKNLSSYLIISLLNTNCTDYQLDKSLIVLPSFTLFQLHIILEYSKEFSSCSHTVLRNAWIVLCHSLCSAHFLRFFSSSCNNVNVQHATFMHPNCRQFETNWSWYKKRTKWNEIMMSLTAIKSFDLVQR